MRGKPWAVDMLFRQSVAANIDGVVKRAETMACKNERENVRCLLGFLFNYLLTSLHVGPAEQWGDGDGSSCSDCYQLDIKRHKSFAACENGGALSAMVLILRLYVSLEYKAPMLVTLLVAGNKNGLIKLFQERLRRIWKDCSQPRGLCSICSSSIALRLTE